MTATQHHIEAWVWTTPSTQLELQVLSADVTLDEEWSPYGQVALVCAIHEDYQQIDPRNDLRVEVQITNDWDAYPVGVRLFDLALRAREIDHKAGTMTLTLATDERLLMDIRNVTEFDDDSYVEYQQSLLLLVDAFLTDTLGADIDPYSADADLTIYQSQTNLVPNPSAATLAGWTASSCTLTQFSGTGAVFGANCFRLTSPTTDDSYIESAAITVEPGERYVLSGFMFCNGTASGTAFDYRRCLVLVTAAAGTFIAQTPNGPGSGMSVPQEQSVEFTMPGVTSVKLRAYLGTATSGDIRFDGIKLSPKTDAFDESFFDGSTADTAEYTYAWTGAVSASPSTRTDITNTGRSAEMLTWKPGMDAWSFLEPLVEAAGLRLFCDELRIWRLVDPATYTVSGVPEIETGENLTDGIETIDRASEEWFNAVVVKYSWIDKRGNPQVRYDVAGSGTKAALFEHERPWPGPGAAAALLARAELRGLAYAVSAIADPSVTPAQTAHITMPGFIPQAGTVSAVTWRYPDDEMSVKSRGIGDI